MAISFGNWILNTFALFAPGGYSLRPSLQRMRGVKIGKKVWLSLFVYIDGNHPDVVTIGNNVAIGLRTTIFSHFYSGPLRSSNHAKPVHIEDDVFIGPHCVILPGVRIGKGAVIQAGTVVSRNVPEFTLWGMPKAGPLARVTTPCPHQDEAAFVSGLRPFKNQEG